MISDPNEIAAVFAHSPLAGLRVEAEDNGCFAVRGIDPANILPAWQAARDTVPLHGRWPLCRVGGAWDHTRDISAETLADFDTAARSLNPWYGDFRLDREDVELDDDEVALWTPDFHGADLLTAAGQQLEAPTLETLNRWIFERILTDPGLLAQAHQVADGYVGTQWWYQPSQADLWLLPTPLPHMAPVWTTLFDADQLQLGAVLWQWHQQWGAELVANWGTMLQLVVRRQPTLGDAAWDLALQHKAAATHQEADTWALALALTRSDAWFLHRRP
ncbi:hypothetical protein Rhe02_08480 [Rhizocola hellebori]|uniref:DUF4253 domain-containing protein n=1 Tax=Rhizocola hellebori TaxID=1392758 RepID=A0A8J3Q3M3_9ACTN|nr:hypothetical protein [Rhizocola hellebori]GIH02781.1 hypothetical protein Rhe02_08480 [Rhizocola hellebori]